MKEGAKIVSSKAFCPLNFRITDRNLSGKLIFGYCLCNNCDALPTKLGASDIMVIVFDIIVRSTLSAVIWYQNQIPTPAFAWPFL